MLEKLLRWYDAAGRDLPWRRRPGDEARDGPVAAYDVLVSEIMLQQTTVATVMPRFGRFKERFPDIEALARAELADVLHEWQGLGYYRRARSLHAAAREVMASLQGHLPQDVERLQTLPGIGRYTAAAIAAIAFNRPVVPVDGNIARIVTRLFALEHIWPREFLAIAGAAEIFVEANRPGDVAQALMDLGATVCRPRKPDCRACPVSVHCKAARLNQAENYPRREPRRDKRKLYANACFVTDGRGRILLRRRPESGILAGLMELPSSPWLEQPTQEVPIGLRADRIMAGEVRHLFTHIDLRIRLFAATQIGTVEGSWRDRDALSGLALPTMTKKLLREAGIES